MKRALGLFLFAALLLAGCNEKTQDAKLILYETQISPEVTALPDANYTGEVSIGPQGKKVPVRITWSAGQDKEGCLKIVDLKVERTGGDPSLVISNVNHTTTTCAMKGESSDTTRFQPAYINLRYETRKGLKTYVFGGNIVTIRGNGEFFPYSDYAAEFSR